jgi:hypothetical protein
MVRNAIAREILPASKNTPGPISILYSNVESQVDIKNHVIGIETISEIPII